MLFRTLNTKPSKKPRELRFLAADYHSLRHRTLNYVCNLGRWRLTQWGGEKKKIEPYFYTYNFTNNLTTTQQLPLHLKYIHCHTFIYTISTVRLTCNTLQPYSTIISFTQFPSYQHGRSLADGAVPDDVIDHDSRLKVGVNVNWIRCINMRTRTIRTIKYEYFISESDTVIRPYDCKYKVSECVLIKSTK